MTSLVSNNWALLIITQLYTLIHGSDTTEYNKLQSDSES